MLWEGYSSDICVYIYGNYIRHCGESGMGVPFKSYNGILVLLGTLETIRLRVTAW